VATSTGLRRVGRLLLAGSLAILPVIGLATPVRAATPIELESCFLAQINAARVVNGAPTLDLAPDLSNYGRSHSTTMSAAGYLFHSGSEQLQPVLPSGWQAWGENVGYATGSDSCDWLFEAFWESPGHRDILLNPIFDIVGIGVIIDAEDTIWTTHVFVQTSNPPPATTTTTTQPAPTTTTTTTHAQQPSTTSSTEPAAIETTSSSATTVVTIETSSGAGETAEATATIESRAGTEREAAAIDVGEPLVAGIETRCTTGCSTLPSYIMFLILLGAAGGGVSWWAFRS